MKALEDFLGDEHYDQLIELVKGHLMPFMTELNGRGVAPPVLAHGFLKNGIAGLVTLGVPEEVIRELIEREIQGLTQTLEIISGAARRLQ